MGHLTSSVSPVFPPVSARDRLHAATLVDGLSSRIAVEALARDPTAWERPRGLSERALLRWVSGRSDSELPGRYLAECAHLRELGAWLRTPLDRDWPLDGVLSGVLRGLGTLPSGVRLGIVGSRKADPYGVEIAERLARSAAIRGAAVVSGGAFGVDIAAHRAALAAGGETVVVLGAGLNHPGPRAHLSVFDAAARRGAVVSCFECDRRAAQWTFLRRNEWVSALSTALVVVQAGSKSGALSTAAHALRMNRPVWIVPGPIDAPLHRGCHALVERGARVLTSIEAWARTEDGVDVVDVGADEGPNEGHSLWAVAGVEPVALSALARRAGLPIDVALVMATQLELSGWFRQAPGTRYARARSPRRPA